jgi:hypothetical protein
MRAFLIAAALAAAGLAGGARAEPLPLDEGGLRAVTAGMAAAPIGPVNVNVSNPVTVTNRVDVSNQVGAAIAVGVTAAIAAFSGGVTAAGGAASAGGPGAP